MRAASENLQRDWAAVGLLLLADGALLLTTNFRLLWRPEIFILLSASLLLLIALLYSTIRDAPRLANMAIIGSLLLLLTNGAAVLNYILAGILPLPLWDTRLNAADLLLGLDWSGFYHWLKAHQNLNFVSTIIYFSLGPEVIGLVLLLEMLGRHALSVSFWRQYAISALSTVCLGVILPATGPFGFYHIPLTPSMEYVAQFAGLRDGSFRVIDLSNAQGLVSFPSFHTILAILCSYAAWPLRYAAWPILLLNILIIVSAPVVGGHYFVDILAGAILAVMVIAGEQKASN